MLPVFWFDEQIYLFIIYFNFLGTYQKPYVALIDGITMGGVSIYLKLSSCCTSAPADGAVCSDLAEYLALKELSAEAMWASLSLCLQNKKMNEGHFI